MARTKNAKTTTAKATEKKVDATPAPEPVQEDAVNEVIDTPSAEEFRFHHHHTFSNALDN